MAKQVINIGNAANDGTGDTLRTGAYKVNQNFNELYAAMGSSILSIAAGEGISTSSNGLGQIVISNTLPNRLSINRIEVSDQLPIVADSLSSTISFTAGLNINLLSEPVTKTITISVDPEYVGNITGNVKSTSTGSTVINTATTTAAFIGDLTGNVTGKLNGINYPVSFGSLGQVLISNGAGTLSWSTIPNVPSIGNFRFTLNTLSTTNINEDVIISPRGTGLVVVPNQVTVTNTTESTSTVTGAMIVAGGIGVAKTVTANEFVGDGSGLTNLDASSIINGTISTDILGIGTADDTTYLRGDGIWSAVALGGTQGPRGLQGIQGLLGLQGVFGPRGDIGLQGIEGTQGIQGRYGLQGAIGTGLQGTVGSQGTFGLQGYLGVQGTVGAGLQGTQGLQGTDGLIGYTGTQGLQGSYGLQGIQGRIGAQGVRGIQGAQGLQGRDGLGLQGIQGTNVQGTQGTTGIQGSYGIQGGYGVQGIVGGDVMISDDTTSNLTYYVGMLANTSGPLTISYVSSTKLSFNPSTGTLTTIDLNTTSDRRLKTNIKQIEKPLDILQKINGYQFNWLETGKLSYGVLAQELEQVLPALISENENGYKTVNYLPLIAFLIEAIKSQQNQINNLK